MQREQVPVWWDVCETVAEKHGLVVSLHESPTADHLMQLSSPETGYVHIEKTAIGREVGREDYYLCVYQMAQRWWETQDRQNRVTKRRARKGKNQ